MHKILVGKKSQTNNYGQKVETHPIASCPRILGKKPGGSFKTFLKTCL